MQGRAGDLQRAGILRRAAGNDRYLMAPVHTCVRGTAVKDFPARHPDEMQRVPVGHDGMSSSGRTHRAPSAQWRQRTPLGAERDREAEKKNAGYHQPPESGRPLDSAPARYSGYVSFELLHDLIPSVVRAGVANRKNARSIDDDKVA